MEIRDAVALINNGVRGHDGIWADLGAGTGTFTRALVELLSTTSRIYAVDRDASAVKRLQRWSAADAPNVVAIHADITEPLESQGLLLDAPLDGMLLANALHFIRDAEHVLARLVRMLRSGGRVVIVEYDQRDASRWVPYPIAIDQLGSLAAAAGLTTPKVIATRPSEYQGILYAAAAERAAGRGAR